MRGEDGHTQANMTRKIMDLTPNSSETRVNDENSNSVSQEKKISALSAVWEYLGFQGQA